MWIRHRRILKIKITSVQPKTHISGNSYPLNENKILPQIAWCYKHKQNSLTKKPQSYLLVDIYSSRKVSLYSWGISNSGCSTLILTTACWCSTLHVSSSLRRSWIILNLSVPRLPYLPGWLEKSNIYLCFNGNTKKFKIYILLTNFFFFLDVFLLILVFKVK